jgi:hypothetical protein
LLTQGSQIPKGGERPFSEFISTPVITSIKYGPISITVDENRFQIVDSSYFEHSGSTAIARITRRYFGELLRYTPLQVAGVNFNGEIVFGDQEDERAFDKRLGIDRPSVESKFTQVEHLRISAKISFQRANDSIELQVNKPRDPSLRCTVNFNIEFRSEDVDSLLESIDRLDTFFQDFVGLLTSLEVEVPS